MLKVLIACEESQRVATAFRELGHEAYSCDLQKPSGGGLEYHILGDVLQVIDGDCSFWTMDGKQHAVEKWSIVIAHPNCQYLCVTANKYYNVEKYGQKAIERAQKREEALEFFMKMYNANSDHVAVENPIGIVSTRFRKPDQIIQPYMFGDHARKATCLWLRGLPPLKPTNVVDPGEINKAGQSIGAHADGRDENGKWMRFRDPELSKLRAKTFPGIAKAFAEQWSEYVEGLK